MDIGFTGTQSGMTSEQMGRVEVLLVFQSESGDEPLRVHHGDCIGADFEFHQIARKMGAYIIGHPPVKIDKRAFCDFDEIRKELPYHDRNHNIVFESTHLIAASRLMTSELRSGTWSTVRFAQRHGRTTDVVLPDGSLLLSSV